MRTSWVGSAATDTLTGAQHFAAIRSYAATAGESNIYQALIQFAEGNAWLPPATGPVTEALSRRKANVLIRGRESRGRPPRAITPYGQEGKRKETSLA